MRSNGRVFRTGAPFTGLYLADFVSNLIAEDMSDRADDTKEYYPEKQFKNRRDFNKKMRKRMENV